MRADLEDWNMYTHYVNVPPVLFLKVPMTLFSFINKPRTVIQNIFIQLDSQIHKGKDPISEYNTLNV